jgi:hypothetical protein
MGLFDFLSGTKRPASGTPVASRDDLRTRLLALNRATAPWVVVDGANDGVDLVAQWSFRETVQEEAFRTSEISTVFRVLMRLDETAHEVRAGDREYKVGWSDNGGLQLSVATSAFRGQKQTVSFGPAFYTERLPSGETVEYRFATTELKKPIQAVVTGGGWIYKGVVFDKL